jgi:Phosphoinositide-specific phospholipase C, efhand-like
MAEFIKEAPKFVTARECVTRAVKTLEAHTRDTEKITSQNFRHFLRTKRSRSDAVSALAYEIIRAADHNDERDARKLDQMCLIIIAVLASGFHARDA